MNWMALARAHSGSANNSSGSTNDSSKQVSTQETAAPAASEEGKVTATCEPQSSVGGSAVAPVQEAAQVLSSLGARRTFMNWRDELRHWEQEHGRVLASGSGEQGGTCSGVQVTLLHRVYVPPDPSGPLLSSTPQPEDSSDWMLGDEIPSGPVPAAGGPETAADLSREASPEAISGRGGSSTSISMDSPCLDTPTGSGSKSSGTSSGGTLGRTLRAAVAAVDEVTAAAAAFVSAIAVVDELSASTRAVLGAASSLTGTPRAGAGASTVFAPGRLDGGGHDGQADPQLVSVTLSTVETGAQSELPASCAAGDAVVVGLAAIEDDYTRPVRLSICPAAQQPEHPSTAPNTSCPLVHVHIDVLQPSLPVSAGDQEVPQQCGSDAAELVPHTHHPVVVDDVFGELFEPPADAEPVPEGDPASVLETAFGARLMAALRTMSQGLGPLGRRRALPQQQQFAAPAMDSQQVQQPAVVAEDPLDALDYEQAAQVAHRALSAAEKGEGQQFEMSEEDSRAAQALLAALQQGLFQDLVGGLGQAEAAETGEAAAVEAPKQKQKPMGMVEAHELEVIRRHYAWVAELERRAAAEAAARDAEAKARVEAEEAAACAQLVHQVATTLFGRVVDAACAREQAEAAVAASVRVGAVVAAAVPMETASGAAVAADGVAKDSSLVAASSGFNAPEDRRSSPGAAAAATAPAWQPEWPQPHVPVAGPSAQGDDGAKDWASFGTPLPHTALGTAPLGSSSTDASPVAAAAGISSPTDVPAVADTASFEPAMWPEPSSHLVASEGCSTPAASAAVGAPQALPHGDASSIENEPSLNALEAFVSSAHKPAFKPAHAASDVFAVSSAVASPGAATSANGTPGGRRELSWEELLGPGAASLLGTPGPSPAAGPAGRPRPPAAGFVEQGEDAGEWGPLQGADGTCTAAAAPLFCQQQGSGSVSSGAQQWEQGQELTADQDQDARSGSAEEGLDEEQILQDAVTAAASAAAAVQEEEVLSALSRLLVAGVVSPLTVSAPAAVVREAKARAARALRLDSPGPSPLQAAHTALAGMGSPTTSSTPLAAAASYSPSPAAAISGAPMPSAIILSTGVHVTSASYAAGYSGAADLALVQAAFPGSYRPQPLTQLQWLQQAQLQQVLAESPNRYAFAELVGDELGSERRKRQHGRSLAEARTAAAVSIAHVSPSMPASLPAAGAGAGTCPPSPAAAGAGGASDLQLPGPPLTPSRGWLAEPPPPLADLEPSQPYVPQQETEPDQDPLRELVPELLAGPEAARAALTHSRPSSTAVASPQSNSLSATTGAVVPWAAAGSSASVPGLIQQAPAPQEWLQSFKAAVTPSRGALPGARTPPPTPFWARLAAPESGPDGFGFGADGVMGPAACVARAESPASLQALDPLHGTGGQGTPLRASAAHSAPFGMLPGPLSGSRSNVSGSRKGRKRGKEAAPSHGSPAFSRPGAAPFPDAQHPASPLHLDAQLQLASAGGMTWAQPYPPFPVCLLAPPGTYPANMRPGMQVPLPPMPLQLLQPAGGSPGGPFYYRSAAGSTACTLPPGSVGAAAAPHVSNFTLVDAEHSVGRQGADSLGSDASGRHSSAYAPYLPLPPTNMAQGGSPLLASHPVWTPATSFYTVAPGSAYTYHTLPTVGGSSRLGGGSGAVGQQEDKAADAVRRLF